MHVGPYDTIKVGYETVPAWLAAHDLPVTGPPREVYLSEPDTPPEQVKTIIEFPVADVAVPVATG